MISIPLIRRELTSDLLGRHIYLFGAGATTTDVLRRLAEAGAQEGTVVLSAIEETRLSAAVLFRPDLPVGAVPLFSAIATLALAEAISEDELNVVPVWPDQVTVEGETVGRIVVEAAPAGDRTSYVVLGADIDVCALQRTRGAPIDLNFAVAAFLNAIDKWATVYATRGPAAVRAAIRFLPRGPIALTRALEGQSAS